MLFYKSIRLLYIMSYLQKIIYHKSDFSHTGKNLLILKLSIQVPYFINWLFRTQIKHMIVVFTHLHIIKPILKICYIFLKWNSIEKMCVLHSFENILLHNGVIYGKLSFTKNCAEYQLYRLSKCYPIIVCARVCNMQENFLYLPRCLSILALKRKYLLPACLLYSNQSNTNCNDIGNTKTVVIFQSL